MTTVRQHVETPPLEGLLIDQFGRSHQYLRISLTDRCNFRCQYCMPHEGMVWQPKKTLLTYEEIERLARIFVQLGVTKIRLTGGEPTVREDLPVLTQKLSSIDGLQHLAMTTNGTSLAQWASVYKASGLDSVNISLDTLDPKRFLEITRRDALPLVLEGIDAALQVGFQPVKINMVVMAGVNDDEVFRFVDTFKHQPVHIRLIEFMPFKANQWRVDRMIPYREVLEVLETRFQLQRLATEASAVGKDYALVGYPAVVSFITSMSEHFCGTCNRVRLTADGSIKPCLLHAAEVSLRDAIRGGVEDSELAQMILETLWRKPIGHDPLETLSGEANRSMIQIGG
jgi:cyclic pyranopterin phosphate synthase